MLKLTTVIDNGFLPISPGLLHCVCLHQEGREFGEALHSMEGSPAGRGRYQGSRLRCLRQVSLTTSKSSPSTTANIRCSDEQVPAANLPIQYPRIPGHEIVGDVVAVPATEKLWKVGQRVGGGWHGGHCMTCSSCRKGDYVTCQKEDINGTCMALLSMSREWTHMPLRRDIQGWRIRRVLHSPERGGRFCS